MDIIPENQVMKVAIPKPVPRPAQDAEPESSEELALSPSWLSRGPSAFLDERRRRGCLVQASTSRPSEQDGAPRRRSSEAYMPTVRWGSAAAQGQRYSMEDAHIAVPNVEAYSGRTYDGPGAHAFFGVFDGHGGTSAADFARRHLLTMLLGHSAFPGRPAEALRAAFTALDEAYYRAVHRAEAPERDAGATALAALVWGGRLVVANAGDSRAVLSRRGRAINLSRDHKPSCPSERERVATAGGYVCGEGFLNGQLTVTRGLGDFHPEMRDTHELRERLKYAASGQGAGGALRLVGPLTSDPEVHTHALQAEDEFLVVACDGLWDVLSSQRCVELARAHLRENNSPELCAQHLVDMSLEMHSGDNVTALVVCFSADAPPARSFGSGRLGLRSLSRDGLSTLSSALSSALSDAAPALAAE